MTIIQTLNTILMWIDANELQLHTLYLPQEYMDVLNTTNLQTVEQELFEAHMTSRTKYGMTNSSSRDIWDLINMLYLLQAVKK